MAKMKYLAIIGLLVLFGFIAGCTNSKMTKDQAYSIAASSDCVKEGNLKDSYVHNEGTRTWWIDLDATKSGCSPACVVSEDTKTAEINWRCTGLLPQ